MLRISGTCSMSVRLPVYHIAFVYMRYHNKQETFILSYVKLNWLKPKTVITNFARLKNMKMTSLTCHSLTSGVLSDLFREIFILFKYLSCLHYHRKEWIKYCNLNIFCFFFLAFYTNETQVINMSLIGWWFTNEMELKHSLITVMHLNI